MIFFGENIWISLKISLKFFRNVRINNVPSLVQIMAWCRPGDKPFSEQWRLVYWRIYAALGLNELFYFEWMRLCNRALTPWHMPILGINQTIPLCRFIWYFFSSWGRKWEKWRGLWRMSLSAAGKTEITARTITGCAKPKRRETRIMMKFSENSSCIFGPLYRELL